jgi:small subunit ribosomal protein S17
VQNEQSASIDWFVTSDKMMKTVVVEVTRTYQHPLYKKVVHESNRFKAHDELGAKWVTRL